MPTFVTQQTNSGKRNSNLNELQTRRREFPRLTAWTAFNRFMNTQLLPLMVPLQLQSAHENGQIIRLVCYHNWLIITRTSIIEYNLFYQEQIFFVNYLT